MKQLLVDATFLTYPYPSNQYILDIDANNKPTRTVLFQMVEREVRVVAYYSKAFNPPLWNYCVTLRKLIVAVLAVSYFRPYL